MKYLDRMKFKAQEKAAGGGDIVILAMETSCDETSAAVVRNGREVLSNAISSQIDVHKKFGGVVPEVASRKHIEIITRVTNQALEEANLTLEDIDGIAVTHGPGLVGALLVGVATAKALAYSLEVPLMGANHIKGHIFANFIQDKTLEPPFLCLVVSGGHTHLIYIKDYFNFEVMGKTRDDAAGEAFDKIARALGLGYPGGPLVDKMAKLGDRSSIKFPRAYLEEGSLDFSFSGLKSAVLNYLNGLKQKGEEYNIPNICASFQHGVVEVLVDKTMEAAKRCNVSTIAIAGGVASNSYLREMMTDRAARENLKLVYPAPILCTDNAAMIGCVGYYNYIKGRISDLDLNAEPSLKL